MENVKSTLPYVAATNCHVAMKYLLSGYRLNEKPDV